MLRTNFSKKDLRIYEQSIAEFETETGSSRFSICNRAYTKYGQVIEDHMSLHDSENSNLSLFWQIYDKIRDSHEKLNVT